MTLLDEAAAYLAGPEEASHDLMLRLVQELRRALDSEERLAVEVYLCRSRLHDLLSDERPVIPHG